MPIITPTTQVAASLVSECNAYFEGKDKSPTRFSLSHKNLMRLTKHPHYVPSEYIDQLRQAMVDLDWLMFQTEPDIYAFLHMSKTKNWARISPKLELGE